MKKIFKFAQRFGFSNFLSKRNQRKIFTNIFLRTKSKQKKEEIIEKPEKENEEETDVERKVNLDSFSENSWEEYKNNGKDENSILKAIKKLKEQGLETLKDTEEQIDKDASFTNEEWKDDSLLVDILTNIYQREKREEFLQEHKNVLTKNGLKFLKDWILLTVEQKDKDGYPSGLRLVLDKAAGK
jgi:hypothetical protein